MLSPSNRAHLFVRPRFKEELTRCFTSVLGCGAPVRLDAPGLAEPVLGFELPDGGSVSVEFTEDAPDQLETRHGAWLEVRSDDPSALKDRILEAGLTAPGPAGHRHASHPRRGRRRGAAARHRGRQSVVHGLLAVTVRPWRIVVDQTAS